jgi:hypothetical protein
MDKRTVDSTNNILPTGAGRAKGSQKSRQLHTTTAGVFDQSSWVETQHMSPDQYPLYRYATYQIDGGPGGVIMVPNAYPGSGLQGKDAWRWSPPAWPNFFTLTPLPQGFAEEVRGTQTTYAGSPLASVRNPTTILDTDEVWEMKQGRKLVGYLVKRGNDLRWVGKTGELVNGMYFKPKQTTFQKTTARPTGTGWSEATTPPVTGAESPH